MLIIQIIELDNFFTYSNNVIQRRVNTFS